MLREILQQKQLPTGKIPYGAILKTAGCISFFLASVVRQVLIVVTCTHGQPMGIRA
jgi:hypothetical protein